MRTNLQGPYFLTQQIAGLMVEQKKASPDSAASIVFVTSVSADMASPNRGEYCVSKAGLAMTTKLFALRLAELRSPSTEIRPGIIADRHDRRRCAISTIVELPTACIPDRRWGTPEDVGGAAAALLRGDVPARNRNGPPRRRRPDHPPAVTAAKTRPGLDEFDELVRRTYVGPPFSC